MTTKNLVRIPGDSSKNRGRDTGWGHHRPFAPEVISLFPPSWPGNFPCRGLFAALSRCLFRVGSGPPSHPLAQPSQEGQDCREGMDECP